YLAAAEAAVQRAVLTEQPPPPTRRVSANFLQPRTFMRDIRVRSLYANGDAVYTNRHTLQDDGEYVLRMRGLPMPKDDTPVRFALTDNDREVKTFEVKKVPEAKPATYEVRLSLKKGEHQVGVRMLSNFKPPEKPEEPPAPGQRRIPRSPGVHVGVVELEGPMD